MSHSCKNLILICLDFRFQKAVAEWADGRGMAKDYDLISLAGAQKALIDADTRETVMKQLDISARLHGINKVIMIAHQDCGAYGGSKAFNTLEEEKQKYASDLKKAESIILMKYPQLTVEIWILLSEGEYKAVFEEVI